MTGRISARLTEKAVIRGYDTLQKCPLAHPWSSHTRYPFHANSILFTLCWEITNSPDTQEISINHSVLYPEHENQSQKKAKTSRGNKQTNKQNTTKTHPTTGVRICFFLSLWVLSGNFFLHQMLPPSLINFLTCPNILSAPNPRQAFQGHSNPTTAGWPTPHKADTNLLQLHELQSASCSISALPLPIQLKHKKQHQKKKAQWTAS